MNKMFSNFNLNSIKKFLICPLTKKYFLEPFIIASGITYEKEAFLAYFEETKSENFVICPVTGKRIFDFKIESLFDNNEHFFLNSNVKEIVDSMFKSGLISIQERYRRSFFNSPLIKSNYYNYEHFSIEPKNHRSIM